MSIFVKPTLANPPKTQDSLKIAYFYAFVLVVFVLAQLFTYDDLLKLFEGLLLPGGIPTAHVLCAVIVISELFALPFLLRMSLSYLMRISSMALSCLVPLIWLFISIWINLSGVAIPNVGFLGTAVNIIPGWWTVFVSMALGILAIWSSWGLWPGERK
jgi:hypothetical protein